MRGDDEFEGVTLTKEGEQIMARFLCSKKAASLVDKFKIAAMGEFSTKCWKDSTDPTEHELYEDWKRLLAESHDDLVEYISELESLKAEQ